MKILLLALPALAACYESLGHHAYDHHLYDHAVADHAYDHAVADHLAYDHAIADRLAAEQVATAYRSASLPPKSPDAVSIILAAPTCPFVDLGMLQATDVDVMWPEPQLERLKYGAAALGADALLVLHDDPYGHHFTTGGVSAHGYSAHAIVFTADCTAP